MAVNLTEELRRIHHGLALGEVELTPARERVGFRLAITPKRVVSGEVSFPVPDKALLRFTVGGKKIGFEIARRWGTPVGRYRSETVYLSGKPTDLSEKELFWATEVARKLALRLFRKTWTGMENRGELLNRVNNASHDFSECLNKFVMPLEHVRLEEAKTAGYRDDETAADELYRVRTVFEERVKEMRGVHVDVTPAGALLHLQTSSGSEPQSFEFDATNRTVRFTVGNRRYEIVNEGHARLEDAPGGVLLTSGGIQQKVVGNEALRAHEIAYNVANYVWRIHKNAKTEGERRLRSNAENYGKAAWGVLENH